MTEEPPPPRRLSERRGRRPPEEPYLGLPEHLKVPLTHWAVDFLGRHPHGETSSEYEANLRRLANLSRIELSILEQNTLFQLLYLAQDLRLDPEAEQFFDVVDMHLQVFGAGSAELADLLRDGGSVWTVGGDPPQLIDRVSKDQQDQFDAAVAPADSASDLLSRAWVKTHARHPDPTGAWADAVKAVEELLAPVAAPKDNRPQLGKMIGYIAQAPHKWTTTIRQDKVAALDVFVDALRVLYPNPGRHDGKEATREEAEAAVGLAVLLVSWLRSGAFRRADPSTGPASP